MSSKWLYDDMPDVPGLFGDGLVDGTFLIYKRAAQQKGDFVLNVVFKGKITKHLITVVDDGMQVGKNTFDCKSIEELVEELSQPNVPGWPVQLTDPPSTTSPASDSGAVSTSDLVVDETMPWLHKDISRERAAELVMEVGKDGTFLVRPREGTGDYAMCVVYKGRPTHHIVQPNDDGVMMVNKKTFGNTSGLPQLIAILQQPGTPGWPVALSHGVKAEETKTETEKTPPRPAADKPPPRPVAAKPSVAEESVVERLPPPIDTTTPTSTVTTTVDSSDKNKFDEVSSNAQGISNHMTSSRPKPQGRRPSSRSSSSTSLPASVEPTNDNESVQPTITTTTTESIVEPTAGDIEPTEPIKPTATPQPVEMPDSTDQTTLMKWLKTSASASNTPADLPDEELHVGVVVSLLRSCLEELEGAGITNIDGDEVMGGVGAITTSTITQAHFLKIVRDPEYRADLRDAKFKMAKAKKLAEEAKAKRLSDVATEEQVASDLERQAEAVEQKLAEMERMKKMPNWKRDQMRSSIDEEAATETTNAEEPDWKLDLKVKKKRASMITSPASPTSTSQLSGAHDEEAKLVLRMLITINKGESTIPIKSEIPSTVSKQTLLKTWEMAAEVFILPQTSRLTRYLEQAQGQISLKAFETVVTPVIKSSTLVSDQSATKTEEASSRGKVFVARDEQERADREALENKNAALFAAKEAKVAAKREEAERQQQEEIEKQTQEEEEQMLLAAMPSWKRELYLRDKGSLSGHRKAKRQSVQMVSSVQTLLQKRLERNAEEERIAEEKASQVTDTMTVNRAWDLLSASRDVPRSTSTSPSIEKSRRQTLMEGLQQIGQPPKVLPPVDEDIPEDVDDDGKEKEAEDTEDNEGDAAALELEKKAKEIDEKIRMLRDKKKKEKEVAAVKIQAGFRGSLGRKKAKQIKKQMEEHQRGMTARQSELDNIMQQQAQLQSQTLILQKQHLLQKMQTQQELAHKKSELQSQQGRGGRHSQTIRVAPPRQRLSSDSSSATSSTVRGPRSSQSEHVATVARKSRTETLQLNLGTVDSLSTIPSDNENALARQDAIERIRMKSLHNTATHAKKKTRVLDGSGLFIVDGYYLDPSGKFAVSEKDHPQDLPTNFTANSPIKMMHKTKSFA